MLLRPPADAGPTISGSPDSYYDCVQQNPHLYKPGKTQGEKNHGSGEVKCKRVYHEGMEKNMETNIINGLYRDPGTTIRIPSFLAN